MDNFMSTRQIFGQRRALWTTSVILVLSMIIGLMFGERAIAATNVVVWDTGSAFADRIETEKRSGWVAVPSEMFAFEKDPPKAASDPGYYGRQYSFKGDAVVENRRLTAVFWAEKGRVEIYAKENATAEGLD